MINPKLPRARYSMPFIVAVGGLALYLANCLGWPSPDTTLAAGLFLDIVGATVLAIPDVPIIHGRFFSGKVRSTVDHLQLERGANESILVEPGTDERFVDSLYIVEDVSGEAVAESDLLENVVQAPEPSSEGFYELREAFREGTNSPIYDRVFGFKVYEMENGDWGTYLMYNNDGNPAIQLKSKYSNPFDKIERTLRRSDARFRRMGLSLLIAGFVFQGISIVV